MDKKDKQSPQAGVTICVGVEKDGTIMVLFDRTLDRFALAPVEVIHLTQILLQKVQVSLQGDRPSRIIKPN